MVREAHHVKSLFNTGVVLYLTGIAVLVLLGMISGTATNRSWAPDAANLQYEQYWKLHGGMEAVSNRADMLSDNLLALGAQYGWQLAGMMLMGAALMRSGWLKGQFSLRHYRRTGALLVAAGMAVNLPAIFAQWYLARDYRWCAFYCRRRANLAPRCRLSAMPRWLGLLATALPFPPGGRYRLRRTHGADQLPAADPDLHHPVLSSWAVYALRSSAAACLCPPSGPLTSLSHRSGCAASARAGGMAVASVNPACVRHIIERHIQITISITIINKTDVNVSSRVTSLTQRTAGRCQNSLLAKHRR